MIILEDPSEYRPEYQSTDSNGSTKPAVEFRNYTDTNEFYQRVRRIYKEMHTKQTVAFVKDKMATWGTFSKHRMTIMTALDLLNTLIDESDPDVNIPNIVHAFQTAEQIRKVWPEHDWFHLTGLVHDLGKVLAVWGEPQFCVTGDTFPVGCQFADSIVFRKETFSENPDVERKEYSTKYGIYEANCGLDKVTMSWGHDEYFYRVLKHNKSTLPKEGLNMIRFHSFYPWHTGGDYMHLCNEEDLKMMEWVREFNKFDLYTKHNVMPDVEALKPYYQSLIDKYMPGELEW